MSSHFVESNDTVVTAGPKTPNAFFEKAGAKYNAVPDVLPRRAAVRLLMERDELTELSEPEIRRHLSGPLAKMLKDYQESRRRLLSRLLQVMESEDSKDAIRVTTK